MRVPFNVMSDSFGNSVKATYPNACGVIDYVLRDTVTNNVPTWAQVIDSTDINVKFIAVQTNFTDYIGNYTMSLTGTMKNYPVQTATVNFRLNVTEFKNDQLTSVQVRKGTAPILQQPVLSGDV